MIYVLSLWTFDVRFTHIQIMAMVHIELEFHFVRAINLTSRSSRRECKYSWICGIKALISMVNT